MNEYDVVRKLIGPIEPVGDTDVDERRLSHLRSQIVLVNTLLEEIREVSENKSSNMASIKKAGYEANSYLYSLKLWFKGKAFND